eukprot:1321733-Rhodomonas_salina.2
MGMLWLGEGDVDGRRALHRSMLELVESCFARSVNFWPSSGDARCSILPSPSSILQLTPSYSILHHPPSSILHPPCLTLDASWSILHPPYSILHA